MITFELSNDENYNLKNSKEFFSGELVREEEFNKQGEILEYTVFSNSQPETKIVFIDGLLVYDFSVYLIDGTKFATTRVIFGVPYCISFHEDKTIKISFWSKIINNIKKSIIK